jgi:hypothetical protein
MIPGAESLGRHTLAAHSGVKMEEKGGWNKRKESGSRAPALQSLLAERKRTGAPSGAPVLFV